jgi:Bacterial HORMA domain family 1
MSASYTRANTQTSTLTRVIYVTRKVQADLLTVLDHYHYFSENYAQEIIHDIRVYIDEEVISHVKFIWITSGTSLVLEELDYYVISNGIGLADDRSGGIRFRSELSKASFQVRITYNDRWHKMPEAEKKEIRASLKLTWGTASQLTYDAGQWSSERTYSQNGLGVSRSRYTTL